jgi:hypothetical protein
MSKNRRKYDDEIKKADRFHFIKIGEIVKKISHYKMHKEAVQNRHKRDQIVSHERALKRKESKTKV